MKITEALEVIEDSLPIKPENEHLKLFGQMAALIKQKTNNFKDVEGISTEKVDVKAVLDKQGISINDWKEEKGSVKRSEADTVKDLANHLVEIMRAEADAQAELELMKLKSKK